MTTRSDPWLRLLQLVADLDSGEPAAADALDVWLQGRSVSTVLGVDRALRDRSRHQALGLPFFEPDLARVAHWAGRSSALGVLSCVRSGWVREAATRALSDIADRWSTAFLLARASDPVPSVAEAAAQGLLDRRGHSRLLVSCLPLLDQARQRARFPEGVLEVLEASAASAEVALWQAVRSGDSALVRSAALRLAEQARGTDAMTEVLSAALADPHPRVRRWAAERAMDGRYASDAVRTVLLPTLAVDLAPAVRRIAVWAAAREGRVDLLMQAALDPNAEVRFQARRKLRRREGSTQIADRARAILADPGAPRAAVVGALATLSDLGDAFDASLVQGFSTDPRRTVAREAVRALRRLETPG